MNNIRNSIQAALNLMVEAKFVAAAEILFSVLAQPEPEPEQEQRKPMNIEEAFKVINRQAPCPHYEMDTSLGDGRTWAKCHDCGRTFLQDEANQAHESAEQFDNAITTLRAALAQPEPAAPRTMIEDFIVGLANEAIKTPDASIAELLGALGYVRAAAPTASNHPWPLPEQVLEYIAPVGTTWRDMVKFARRVEQEHGIGGGEARADEQIKGMAQQRHRGGGF